MTTPPGPNGRPTPVHPFGGLFSPEKPDPLQANRLLRGTAARRWFDMLAWGVEEDLYTYLQPFDRGAGARVHHGGDSLLMLSSYDYLGLIGHEAIEQAAIKAVHEVGTGTGGVRLLSGTVRLHTELEAAIASFLDLEAAITFSSGYAANTAVLTTLFNPRDLVVADARIHRSVIEGCRGAGVPVRTFRHNDMESLERRLQARPRGRVLVAVEGIYSMDGDICPLPEVLEITERHGTLLMVDDAHSLGVLGSRGRGLHEHFGIESTAVDIWTGSLSKAIPANGGYVAGSRSLIVLLQHEAAPFVFSAALAPPSVAAARASLDVIDEEPERIERAWRNAAALRAELAGLGYCLRGETPLIPLIVGDEEDAWRLTRELFDLGVVAQAVTYPAVPRGASILRLCATASLTSEDIRFAGGAFASARDRLESG